MEVGPAEDRAGGRQGLAQLGWLEKGSIAVEALRSEGLGEPLLEPGGPEGVEETAPRVEREGTEGGGGRPL
jgi:hypothetical protein